MGDRDGHPDGHDVRGFLPTLWHGVLPYVFEGGGPRRRRLARARVDGGAAPPRHLLRRRLPVLALLGLIASRGMPPSARRVLACAVTVGGAILLLRYALPTALRDAKDVELLLRPMAVLSAAGLAVVWGQGAHRTRLAVLAAARRRGLGGRPRLVLYADRLLSLAAGSCPTRPWPRR
jgi:hypothetical protein